MYLKSVFYSILRMQVSCFLVSLIFFESLKIEMNTLGLPISILSLIYFAFEVNTAYKPLRMLKHMCCGFILSLVQILFSLVFEYS